MDPVGASSESEGEGLEPPTPNSLSDRVGWGELDPEDSEGDAVDPEIHQERYTYELMEKFPEYFDHAKKRA
eukprot:1831657-Amphidinium_carterae.1